MVVGEPMRGGVQQLLVDLWRFPIFRFGLRRFGRAGGIDARYFKVVYGVYGVLD